MVSARDSDLMDERKMSARETARAILTDVQFWIPMGLLVGGVGLLVYLK